MQEICCRPALGSFISMPNRGKFCQADLASRDHSCTVHAALSWYPYPGASLGQEPCGGGGGGKRVESQQDASGEELFLP